MNIGTMHEGTSCIVPRTEKRLLYEAERALSYSLFFKIGAVVLHGVTDMV